MSNALSTPNSALDERSASNVLAPMGLLEIAVQRGADPDQLAKLMDLQDRWEAKQARTMFYQALSDFQDKCPNLLKSSDVDYTTTKGRTQYKFAALPDIVKAIRPVLKQCGLTYRWEIANNADQIDVTCIITHEAGHSESTTIPVIRDDSGGKNKIQGVGSGVTYGQRYSLIGALGLTTADEDDDGGRPAVTVDDLLRYNEVVREHFVSISEVKLALAAGEWPRAAEALREIGPRESEPNPANAVNILWKAPTKGGIWTVQERKLMSEGDFITALREYDGTPAA